MNIYGLHHVTAVTAQAKKNLAFYTTVLGLRMVKKTVNQDDTSAYHLFYADKLGTPGTDMTFFDWEQAGPKEVGTDAISATLFRVNGQASLEYWLKRFDELLVKHRPIEQWRGRGWLRFEDAEGQQLGLVDDNGAEFAGQVWDGSDVPVAYGLRGFYAVELSVSDVAVIKVILTEVLGWQSRPVGSDSNQTVYAIDGGGPGKEVVVRQVAGDPTWMSTAGSVHHVAFRVKDEAELRQWMAVLNRTGLANSGVVDRYYFKSLYFRISRGILFELATDGPGFASDESLEHLGETLALPPFLESKRSQIEANLKPLVD